MLLLLLSEDVLLGEQWLLLTPHRLLLRQQGLLLRCQNSGCLLLSNTLELLLSLDAAWFLHFDWISSSAPLHHPLLPLLLLPLWGDPLPLLLLLSSALGDYGSSLALLLPCQCSVQALLRVAQRLLNQLLSNCAALAA